MGILDELHRAAYLRHSYRNFTSDAIDDGARKEIERFIASLETPFENHTKCVFFKAACGKRLYNNGINPPDNIALFSETDLVSISKAGFTGELIVLYAVSLGFTTCWFGHYKLAELGQYFDKIATPERIKESTLGYGYGNHENVGERVVCCIPIGYKNEDKKRLIDRLSQRVGANRKPLEQLVESDLRIIPEDIKAVLDFARLAPSAANSQMWRFHYAPGKLTVAKPIGYKHFKWEHPDVDIGTCAAHIWIGLCHAGYEPTVSVKKENSRAIWVFEW